MSKENGGPAFPVMVENRTDESVFLMGTEILAGKYCQFAGVTVRDYFAGKALSGLCADGATAGTKAVDLVDECYKLADAMLLRRAQ